MEGWWNHPGGNERKRSTQRRYSGLHTSKKLRPRAHDILRGKQWHIQNTPLGGLWRGQKVLPQSYKDDPSRKGFQSIPPIISIHMVASERAGSTTVRGLPLHVPTHNSSRWHPLGMTKIDPLKWAGKFISLPCLSCPFQFPRPIPIKRIENITFKERKTTQPCHPRETVANHCHGVMISFKRHC